MDDRMVGVKYIDNSGKIKELKKPIEKKKYKSKFPIVYTDFGIFLILPILLSTGLGHLADTFFNQRPLFTLIGIVVGGILAIINLYLLLKKEDGSSRTSR